MEILKKIKNNQRGSVTVFVLATMLIVVGIVVTIYMTTINKNNTQIAQLNKIQGEYMQTSDNSAMDQAYNENLEFGPGMIAEKNEEYEDENGDEATIPKGFEILPEAPTIEDGLVIQDEKGNQFVWVPAEVSEMANMTSGTDANGNQNYQGKLYNFTSTGATEKTSYGQDTTSYREPDTVSNYDNNSDYLKIIKDILTDQTDKYTDINTFKKTMQEDYNKMIKSISNYHGFYVSRYEMSKSSNNTAASVGNVTPIVNDSDNKWYGLYAYGKTYTNSANSVESSMIWGSQYDAMMRWMQSGEHGVDVTKDIGNNRNTSTTTSKRSTKRRIETF